VTIYWQCMMPFSKENKALSKNLCQFKKYGSRRIVMEFSKINCKREELDTLLKRFSKHDESGRPKHARTEENVTTVQDELVSLLSQEDQKQILRSTRQISREIGLTQCSIVQIIYRDLGLKCLSFTNTLAGYYR